MPKSSEWRWMRHTGQRHIPMPGLANILLLLSMLLFSSTFWKNALTFALSLGLPFSTVALAEKKVIVIPVEEQVDFGLHAFLKRSVAQALEKHPEVIIFKINTYGGELQSAFDIVDLMTSIKTCSTYAYVEQKAISAGALISLASNRIVMGNSTTIGDCAPITQSQDGIVMLGEKIQSPLRAKFRTLAERNGYPSLLAEAMVTSDMGVVRAESGPKKLVEYFTAKQWESLSEKEKAK